MPRVDTGYTDAGALNGDEKFFLVDDPSGTPGSRNSTPSAIRTYLLANIDADDISVSGTTNKFTTAADITKLAGIETGADVTDATNVDAAGATMNTDTDVSGNSWVLDEDTMVSDSATKVPTQQSVKAYIADTSSPTTSLYLPGSSGNYVSTPDGAQIEVTGDMTLVAHVAMVDWTPAGESMIAARRTGSTNAAWRWNVQATSGVPRLITSPDGTDASQKVYQGGTAPTVADGAWTWLAATIDVDDGASGSIVRFWQSSDGEAWSQLGSNVTSTNTSISGSTTAPLEIGSRDGGTAALANMNIRVFRLYDGIGASGVPGGTLVAEYDASAPAGSRWRDSFGNTWTINGSAWAWSYPSL